eukprot:TRINITY_DN61659_c0_g1_i1.p1 TRINITY_DN61659_c0_g1~~TRINITY_DN61659_c0_g1_i1.p1  ORF type:complete len:416 (+),score=69.49 TRINITY_DN61659_c0_g1_i1:187-1434(+)
MWRLLGMATRPMRSATRFRCTGSLTLAMRHASALPRSQLGSVALAGLLLGGGITCEPEVPPQAKRDQVKLMADEMQQHFVARLKTLRNSSGATAEDCFSQACWQRDGGTHGGGTRYETTATPIFNRASVNVSGVHYDDKPSSPVSGATAISVILHPTNPYAPSMHFHISFIETRNGKPYWRMIADLNPSIPNPAHTRKFEAALAGIVPPKILTAGIDFGNRYFWIPVLGRHRGVSHFFAAKIDTELMSAADTIHMAKNLVEGIVDVYCEAVQDALNSHPEEYLTTADRDAQLAYHTLYLFQVLSLDKGTTYGLLAHRDNDVGTLGSLPNKVDRELLATWRSKMPPVQQLLLDNVLLALPEQNPAPVTPEVRAKLAEVVRSHYRSHPEAVKMQAEMDMRRWGIEAGEGFVLSLIHI